VTAPPADELGSAAGTWVRATVEEINQVFVRNAVATAGGPKLLLLLLVPIVAACGAAPAHTQGAKNTPDLPSMCAKSSPANGYHQVSITTDLLLTGVAGRISVRCTIHLLNGSRLVIDKSHLQTDTLLITDDPRPVPSTMGSGAGSTSQVIQTASPSPIPTPTDGSAVTVDHSSLLGGQGAGLGIVLREPHVSLTIRDSVLDYPLGIEARIGPCCGMQGVRPAGQSKVEVDRTTIRSEGPKSDGIELVADGVGSNALFIDDRIDSIPPPWPLLGGDTCQAVLVPGVTTDCHSGPYKTIVTPYPSPSP